MHSICLVKGSFSIKIYTNQRTQYISCIDTIIPIFFSIFIYTKQVYMYLCIFSMRFILNNTWKVKKRKNRYTPGKKPTHWQNLLCIHFICKPDQLEKCLSCQFDHCFSNSNEKKPDFLHFLSFSVFFFDKYLSKSYNICMKVCICVYVCVCTYFIFLSIPRVTTTFQIEFQKKKSRVRYTPIELYSNGIKMIFLFSILRKIWLLFDIYILSMQNERTHSSVYSVYTINIIRILNR